MHSIIIFGGTFDPIHNGHLQTAKQIQTQFQFNEFVFLPCKIPVLKPNAIATTAQRIEMLRIALSEQSKDFMLDLSEIERTGPSYMVTTLDNFRRRRGIDTSITLLMGMDAFLQLPRWHDWRKILTLANLMIINRPNFNDEELSSSLKELLNVHETRNGDDLRKHSHGLIFRYDAGHFDISSTWIRQQLAKGNNVRAYLPESVLKFIREKHIYS